MKFAIARQQDGSYLLRFERVSVACEIAMTEADLEALVMELQTALPGRSHR
jgi:hypothetical protein